MNTTVNVGVVGTGVMGADHAAVLAREVSGACVRSVADLDADRATAVAQATGAEAVSDPRCLVANDSIDAVVIASADATHEELVLACLEAGKPVLCEKPLAPDPEGAHRIIEAEVANGQRLVTVGFMRRYDPGFAELAAVLRAGDIGTPLLAHCVHRNLAGPSNLDTGLLVNGSGVHEIDTVRWLFAEEIAQVAVHCPRRSSAAPTSAQDPLVLVLETSGGVVANAEIFVNCGYGYEVRCEVVGEDGTATVDEPVLSVRRKQRVRGASVAYDWRDRFAEAYRRELQDWIDGVRLATQRGASAWDGYAAQIVAAAGVQAARSGTRVRPQLPERPHFYD